MFDMTVGDLLLRAARLYPGKVATWYEGRSQTFAEFHADVRSYQSYLSRSGLARGDRVAVLSRNNPELLKLMFAASLGGCVFVPINFRLTAKEIAFVVADSGASLVFADRFFLDTARSAVATVPAFSAERLVELNGDLSSSVLSSSMRGPVGSTSSSPVAGEDVFGIYYTSGTTGNPKGVVLSHRNMVAGVLNHTIAYGLGPADVCLHIMPLYHTMEASMALCQFFVGGSNVIEDHFDQERFWSLVDAYGITHVTAVFTMLSGMLACAPAPGAGSGSSLRTISLGGQAVPVELLKEAVRQLGNDRLIQVYGLTEASPLVTWLPREEIRLDSGRVHRLGSVGKDLFLTTTRVIDDAGNDVGVDEVGEIIVAGPNVMQGYWKREEETASTLKGGWLHTGDVGRRDANGFLYIVDRKKDLIISGGENISPREIEEVLFAHPRVLECSVFGIPDARWGEAVGAAVRTEGELGEQELITYCAQSLGKYKIPRKVWFLDELPKDPVGKIQKRLLRARLADEGTGRGKA